MPRKSQKRYQVQVMLAMLVYVAAMLLLWPMARTAASAPLKWLLAVLPVLPMLYVIALMARRVRDSDELEQRMHLLALGFSTAVVGSLSLIGGFLAASGALALDGSILIWVFPSSLLAYHASLGLIARRYEHDLLCREDGYSMGWRLLAVAALMAGIGMYAWLRHDAMAAGMLIGIAIGLVLVAAITRVLRMKRSAGTSSDESR